MFSFAYPWYLLLLLLVPLFILIYVWARYVRRKNLKKFGKKETIRLLMPEVSEYKPPIKITVELIALTCLVIAFARPWGGVKNEKTVKDGIEVIIAVDASNSMLASSTDDAAGSSRIRTAQITLEKLINRLDNDRIGLIEYANDAYVLSPITSDYASAKMFINSIDPAQVSNQGTNISAAINMAVNSFSDNNVGKAIILITDAEELEDPDAVAAAVKNAVDKKIQVDVIGVGSSVANTIPWNNSVMTDEETGRPVLTKLNETLASKIAKDGNGIYVNASSSDALDELERQLGNLKKLAMESSVYVQHDELFNIFAWIALILIIADIFLLDRKIGWLDKISFFKKEINK